MQANKGEAWTPFKCDSVLFNVWLNKNLQATGGVGVEVVGGGCWWGKGAL